jgi:hypothetical protein
VDIVAPRRALVCCLIDMNYEECSLKCLLAIIDAFSKKIHSRTKQKAPSWWRACLRRRCPELVNVRIVKTDGSLECVRAPFTERLARHNKQPHMPVVNRPLQLYLKTANGTGITHLTCAKRQHNSTQKPASFAVELRKSLKAFAVHTSQCPGTAHPTADIKISRNSSSEQQRQPVV